MWCNVTALAIRGFSIKSIKIIDFTDFTPAFFLSQILNCLTLEIHQIYRRPYKFWHNILKFQKRVCLINSKWDGITSEESLKQKSSRSFQCLNNKFVVSFFIEVIDVELILLLFPTVMKSTLHHRVCRRSAFYPKIYSSKIWKVMIFLCHPNTKSMNFESIFCN